MSRRNKRDVTFTAHVPTVRRALAAQGPAATHTPRVSTVSPSDLPRPARPDIILVDADNIVIGRDSRIDPTVALAALDEVYGQLSTSELSLAVISRTAAEALGHSVWFRYPRWSWRIAEVGPDAADEQLMDFVAVARRQRPRARVTVVSGDGIFAGLVDDGPVDVVVPTGHRPSRRLLPYLRRGVGRA